MKGKAKEKRKIGKAILIGMGFFLTIILTFTTTLAWFYDSDWASKYINMAGTVGIEIRRDKLDGEGNDVNLRTSGTGNLYFHLYNETTDPNAKAYPGQAIDVSASAYNNGGKSGSNGSKCYVRAHFVVYTNIGTLPDKADYKGTAANNGTDAQAYIDAVNLYKTQSGIASPTPTQLEAAGIKGSDYVSTNGTGDDAVAFIRDTNIANQEKGMNADALYAFLYSLIAKQNELKDTTGYYWHYYKLAGALPLSDSGTSDQDLKYYLDGNVISKADATDATVEYDAGYFYLCYANNTTNAPYTGNKDGVLMPLAYTQTAVFLWNDTFIIPWQLTNASADKKLFVGVTFQAVQTFIPKMETTDGGVSTGIINSDADNQLPYTDCTFDSVAVQTVFNSCNFTPIDTSVLDTIFGAGENYDRVSDKDGVVNETPVVIPVTPTT